MGSALEDGAADADSKVEVHKEQGTLMGYVLLILQALQPAFSDRRSPVGRMSDQVAKRGLSMIQAMPHCGFLRGK